MQSTVTPPTTQHAQDVIDARTRLDAGLRVHARHVAALLGVSVRTLRRRIVSGDVPTPSRIDGGRLWWDAKPVRQMI